jgi:putative ABC transport system permease protein
VKRALWTLATLLAHWRRRPVNLAALIIGLAVATALWSGVQALNEQARESYAQASAVFSAEGARTLVSSRGELFSQELYIKLRLAGWKVSPVLEGALRIGKNPIRVIGIEPLTLPAQTRLGHIPSATSLDGFLRPPGEAIASPQTLADLGLAGGATPTTDRGRELPPLRALAEVPPGTLIVDIGAAQSLLERPSLLSRLILNDALPIDRAALAQVVGDALRIVEPEEPPELEKLTASFHLNLTAFGLLAFLVGLFIVHASFGLAFEQRLPTLRTMRAIGVSARTLIAAMLMELSLLVLLAGGAGVICGYLIAAALLPDVAASLDSLYGAQVAGRLTLRASWLMSGLGMAALGGLAAGGGGLLKTSQLPILQTAQPVAWRSEQQRFMRRQGVLAAILLATALAAFLNGESVASGFVAIAGALLGAALLLPLLLSGVLRIAERSAKTAISQWFWADSRQQLSGLSLALMALLLALSTNVGVGAMVEGFRKTFVEWLDQRLLPEVYFEAANAAEGGRVEAWLLRRGDVAAILPVWKAQTRLAGWPVDVVGVRSHETYRAHFPMIGKIEDAWDRLHEGNGALVSEQLARRLKASVGSMIDIPTARGDWRVKIVGVYPDYGNPKGQLRVDLDALVARWPEAQRTGYSLRTAPDAAPGVIRDLQSVFGPSIVRVIDQAGVKALSTRVFERTFAVTAALNILTLIVSGVALAASLTTLGELRLTQLAPIWALGVDRRSLSLLDALRVLLFAAATAIFALPLGLAMAWQLVTVVNVQAFGWRLPFYVFPAQWAVVFALALLTGLLSALAPLVRLAKTSPSDLLKVFASER